MDRYKPTNYVPVGTNVQFRAVPCPDVAWPNGKPVWKGVTTFSASEAEAIFNAPGFYDIKAECGNVVTAKVCAVKIETKTVAIVPVDRTRKTLGVGEEVILTLQPTLLRPVTWSIISGNGTIDTYSESNVKFTAHDSASSTIITATYNKNSFNVTFSVIAPTGIRMEKFPVDYSYPRRHAGAGMYAEVKILPDTVSFYNTEFREIPGPASGVSGYFTNYPPEKLYHKTKEVWSEFGYDNICDNPDECTTEIFLPPWSAGYFVWHIPLRYRLLGSSGEGTKFTEIDQEFEIWENGTVEIRKAGAVVRRSPYSN